MERSNSSFRPRGANWILAAAAFAWLLLLGGAVTLAQSEPSGRPRPARASEGEAARPDRPGKGFGSKRFDQQFAMPAPQRRGPVEHHASEGYVFIDGEYQPPPYVFRLADGELTLNGSPVPLRLPEARQRRGPQDGGPLDQIGMTLDRGGVVLAFANQPLVVFSNASDSYRFLSEMLGRPHEYPVALIDQLPADFDRQVWNGWRKEFRMPPELRERAEADVSTVSAIIDESMAAIAATRRLNQFSYPLTLCGMIATVLGMGHLLSHRPPTGGASLDTDPSPAAIRVISWSLLLIVGLSALDLAWTILASQAGQMRELNPLGSHLLEDPIMLTSFKAGGTLVAVGLLFALRKYRRAQLAAWWCCLILTLLTGRWVMLNSMFVAA